MTRRTEINFLKFRKKYEVIIIIFKLNLNFQLRA